MRTILFSLGILLLMGTAEGFTKMKHEKRGDVVTLKCEEKGVKWYKDGKDLNVSSDSIDLQYDDDNSGEYECFKHDETNGDVSLGVYHVKFRTCANCIELDVAALVGIIVGNIVATGLIGVSVYFIATQSKGPSFPSNKASQESDRRNLIPNDALYQPLSTSGRAAEYDVLHHNPKRR
ncbi:hypothetical protein ACEWY4_008362 [Coilia grayii]|uniref:CD3 gamma/delta subunit Ig-like domain-containing protein n=1 Tax=Coilia grayii TaxID=363190 RepID=A0ABD1KAU6_9TELE